MANRAFYVTTPIYYVNDVPHLGTAYTTIVADALRRFEALRGRETFMLTGTDEHGLKIEREAISRGQSPKAFVDDISARFREAWQKLSIQPTQFIRTTDPEHERLVQELWKRVAANGDLYLGSYEDWYCVGCEGFKTEKELTQPANECPLHPGKPVEKVKEDTYFFRLEKYGPKLLAYYNDHPGFIQPESRRNEVVSFVSSGLKDLSVSRTSFTWGIPVPGDPKHVMYVWFDALANYWTALGGDGTPNEKKFWRDGQVIHLVGKDILRFHAIYWPAFLLSAGLPLPETIYAHGFLTIDGQKMGKSLRNAVDPVRLAETQELGGADGLRYQLLRAVAFGQDGDFDHAALIERYNADLGKNLGNLLSRTLGLAAKVPAEHWQTSADQAGALEDDLEKGTLEAIVSATRDWETFAPQRALEATFALCSQANVYIDRTAPWAAIKREDFARVVTILSRVFDVLETVSALLWPALPNKSNELRVQLGLAPLDGKGGWPDKATHRAWPRLPQGPALFPTIDKDGEKALLERLVPKPVPLPALAPTEAQTPPTTSISYDDFARVDLKVGVVKSAEKVPKKDKLLKLAVDLGEAEPRVIIAGLALTFAPESLVGRRVIVVANLAPRDFGKGLVSHGMLLATGPSEKLVLATAPDDAEPGARLK
mgnify:FL=1